MRFVSHSPEVTVEFKLKGKVVAKVEGKMETLEKKSDWNSLVIGKDSSGRDAIKALLFGDKDFRVVF